MPKLIWQRRRTWLENPAEQTAIEPTRDRLAPEKAGISTAFPRGFQFETAPYEIGAT